MENTSSRSGCSLVRSWWLWITVESGCRGSLLVLSSGRCYSLHRVTEVRVSRFRWWAGCCQGAGSDAGGRLGHARASMVTHDLQVSVFS
jgi:hypothetical protein